MLRLHSRSTKAIFSTRRQDSCVDCRGPTLLDESDECRDPGAPLTNVRRLQTFPRPPTVPLIPKSSRQSVDLLASMTRDVGRSITTRTKFVSPSDTGLLLSVNKCRKLRNFALWQSLQWTTFSKCRLAQWSDLRGHIGTATPLLPVFLFYLY